MMEILIDPKSSRGFQSGFDDGVQILRHLLTPRPEDSPVKDFSAAYQNGTMDRYS